MQQDFLKQINVILERESKSSTYKYALLRCTIEVIQEKSPFIQINHEKATIPLYLLIEKWILAYYPIFENGLQHTQINGDKVPLAFETEMKHLVNYYKIRGGISVLNRDFKVGFPNDVVVFVFNLVKKLKTVITTNPMRYIGSKLFGEHYSIFKQNADSERFIDLSNPIKDLGTFSISRNFYDGFYLLGSFITGQDSILSKWAEFSIRASNEEVSKTTIIEKLLEMPVVKRDQSLIGNYFSELISTGKEVYCVWSGKKITKNFDMEHILPFSLWKNNDLWNLLPSSTSCNSKKSDKIPTPELIQKQQSVIMQGWELYFPKMEQRFLNEFGYSLIGEVRAENQFEKGINRLMEISDYLITVRGYEAWNGNC